MPIYFPHSSDTPTVQAAQSALYAKPDGLLYLRVASGVEMPLSSGGATITTSDATATTLYSLPIAEGEAVALSVVVAGKRSDESNAAGRRLLLLARRQTAANVVSVGTDHGALIGSGVTIDTDVDTATNTLRVRVTGVAAQTWQWTAAFTIVRNSL